MTEFPFPTDADLDLTDLEHWLTGTPSAQQNGGEGNKPEAVVETTAMNLFDWLESPTSPPDNPTELTPTGDASSAELFDWLEPPTSPPDNPTELTPTETTPTGDAPSAELFDWLEPPTSPPDNPTELTPTETTPTGDASSANLFDWPESPASPAQEITLPPGISPQGLWAEIGHLFQTPAFSQTEPAHTPPPIETTINALSQALQTDDGETIHALVQQIQQSHDDNQSIHILLAAMHNWCG